jgi:UDP-glucose 4-epimerase
MTKVLVAGGAGYVGSHTCKALASQGFTPVVFDNFSEGHRDFVQWSDLIEGDVRDKQTLQRAI